MIKTSSRTGFAFRHKEDHLWLRIGEVSQFIKEPYVEYSEHPDIDMASIYAARNILEDDLLRIFYMLTRFECKNSTDVLKAARFHRKNWTICEVEVTHKILKCVD